MNYFARIVAFGLISCAYGEDGIIYPSKDEFGTIVKITKNYIMENTPWNNVEKYNVNICGWMPCEDANELIVAWETECKKSLRSDDKKSPFMVIETKVFDVDVIIVSVSHGTELTGGSFDLYFRKVKDGWILKNSFGGGVR